MVGLGGESEGRESVGVGGQYEVRNLERLEHFHCGHIYPVVELHEGCPKCLGEGRPSNVTSLCSYEAMRFDAKTPDSRFPTMSRSRGLLPVDGDPVGLAEGCILLLPLSPSRRVPDLYAKDESRNPRDSFKNRMASVVLTLAVQIGARTVTIASSGRRGNRRLCGIARFLAEDATWDSAQRRALRADGYDKSPSDWRARWTDG